MTNKLVRLFGFELYFLITSLHYFFQVTGNHAYYGHRVYDIIIHCANLILSCIGIGTCSNISDEHTVTPHTGI